MLYHVDFAVNGNAAGGRHFGTEIEEIAELVLLNGRQLGRHRRTAVIASLHRINGADDAISKPIFVEGELLFMDPWLSFCRIAFHYVASQSITPFLLGE